MKCTQLLIFTIGLFVLCSCTMFGAGQSPQSPVVQSGKSLAVPVGKNWQVIEEAPKLSDGSRLPFQTEQSVQSPGAPPVAPAGSRTIETTR